MCHVPEQGFVVNEIATAVGFEGRSLRRNAPTVIDVGMQRSMFHDGRVRTLEEQVWGPLLARDEMANPSREAVLKRIAGLAGIECVRRAEEAPAVEAREAAVEANRLSPDLIPAAVIAANALTDKGDRKAATRVLKKAWEAQPHPDLAAAFAAIEPEEGPEDRLGRFKVLLAIRPQDEETRLTRAELLLAAKDFTGARESLGSLADDHPTQRTLAILAAAERGAGADEATVRGILARALTASRGPQWCCDKCSAVQESWQPILSLIHISEPTRPY